MGLFKQTFPSRRRAVSSRSTASLFAAAAGAVLFAAAPLCSTAGPASEPHAVALGGDPPAALVRYGDLKVTSEAGARVLLERIRLAADAVCPAVDIRDLGKLTARKSCVRAAIARAVQQVGSARLAAVYSERVGHG